MSGETNNTNRKILIGLGFAIGILILLLLILILVFLVMSKNENNSDITSEQTTEEITEDETSKDTTEALSEEKEEPLSPEELKQLSELISSSRYYGFACCEYQDATYIDWNQVLYTSAGIDCGPLTEEQRQEYMRIEGLDEIYTDVSVINGTDLENFIKETTGTSYKDAKKPLEWGYLPNDDLYVSMHGDTNYQPVNFTGGTRQGDLYTLYYHTLSYTDFEDHDFVMTVQIQGENCVFISNVISTEGNKPQQGPYSKDRNGNPPKGSDSGTTGKNPPTGSGYSDDELGKMALDYYEKNYNYRPDFADVTPDEGNMVVIQLFDDMGDHTATSAWYKVDRTTAVGTDMLCDMAVDLK